MLDFWIYFDGVEQRERRPAKNKEPNNSRVLTIVALFLSFVLSSFYPVALLFLSPKKKVQQNEIKLPSSQPQPQPQPQPSHFISSCTSSTMRIRKHAKISPLLYASSSLKPGTVIQTHVCQLNQSPWDVMTFPPPDPSTLPPPPAFLVDKDHSYFPNGFLSDHIAADQSPGPKVKRDDIAAGGKFEQKESLRSKKEEEDEVFDCKIDGKGWQCRKKVKNEQPFCQRHLAPQPSASVKKSESGRRARPKKPVSSSNPYEFYYYSGFGPRWGKKRGAAAAAAAMKEEPYTSHDSSSENTSSRNNNNNNIIEVDAAEGPNTPEPSVKSSPFTSQFHKQVLDYVEDDDEDDYDNYSKLDDDENGEMGRKRARKPIKARSLKSLM